MTVDPERFLTRLGTVSEVPMRIALWRECFQNQHPEDALRIVQYVLTSQRENHPHSSPALLALARLIQDDAPLVRKALLGAAVVAQDQAVLQLLETPEPVRIAQRAQLRPPSLNTERDVTLGERRSWARSRDRDLLTRLLLDPDPGVIKNLLNNPRLLERDVLRIASAQPVAAEVLRVVFQSNKWCGRRAVQSALLQNPYTPPDLARSLLELLDEVGLRSVVEARQIHQKVRREASSRLSKRLFRPTQPLNPLEDEWVSDLVSRRQFEEDGDDDV